jgi:hypothetical protein
MFAARCALMLWATIGEAVPDIRGLILIGLASIGARAMLPV